MALGLLFLLLILAVGHAQFFKGERNGKRGGRENDREGSGKSNPEDKKKRDVREFRTAAQVRNNCHQGCT